MSDRFKIRIWDRGEKAFRSVDDFLIDMNGDLLYEQPMDDDHGNTRWLRFDTCDQLIKLQSTGLRDKNGVLIFHSDLLSIKYHFLGSYHDGIYKVYCDTQNGTSFHYCKLAWEDGGRNQHPVTTNIRHGMISFFDGTLEVREYDYIDRSSDIEVIGNIYENPELLTTQINH